MSNYGRINAYLNFYILMKLLQILNFIDEKNRNKRLENDTTIIIDNLQEQLKFLSPPICIRSPNTARKTQSRERQVILLKLHAKTIQVSSNKLYEENEGKKNKQFPSPACKSLLPTSRNSLDIFYLSREQPFVFVFEIKKKRTGLIHIRMKQMKNDLDTCGLTKGQLGQEANKPRERED